MWTSPTSLHIQYMLISLPRQKMKHLQMSFPFFFCLYWFAFLEFLNKESGCFCDVSFHFYWCSICKTFCARPSWLSNALTNVSRRCKAKESMKKITSLITQMKHLNRFFPGDSHTWTVWLSCIRMPWLLSVFIYYKPFVSKFIGDFQPLNNFIVNTQCEEWL